MSDRAVTNTGFTLIEECLERGQTTLGEHQAKQLFAAYDIPVTKEQLIRERSGLASAVDAVPPPVVLKIDSPDILHKTEAGLVELGCGSLQEAERAFDRILARSKESHPTARVNGILVQEMVTGVAECIIGMKKDPEFGPTVMFGLGGIFVEVFKDVAFRVTPLTPADAAEMVREVKGYALLAGARGRARADVAALEDVLLKVSRLAVELDHYLEEIDINPIVVRPEGMGAVAVDGLIVLDRPRP